MMEKGKLPNRRRTLAVILWVGCLAPVLFGWLSLGTVPRIHDGLEPDMGRQPLARSGLQSQEPVTDTSPVGSDLRFPRVFLPAVARNAVPANMPDDPWPVHESVDQSFNTFLAWSLHGGNSSGRRFHIYLEAWDSSPDNRITSDLIQEMHYDPYTLSEETTYYWQVEVYDLQEILLAVGPVWSFQTDSVPDRPAVGSMVDIPAGEFRMGCDLSNPAESFCSNDELPLHRVYLDEYEIDRYEVTNRQYRACEGAGVCTRPAEIESKTRPDYHTSPAYDDYPVIHVSWSQATTYCEWVGKRLPTEAEWEKAARGPVDTRRWPWGDEPADCSKLNYYTGSEGCVGDTTAVGSYPEGVSPYGLYDMGGNVWEWVRDRYWAGFYQVSPYENPVAPDKKDTYRAIRGGSYRPYWHYPRVASRHFQEGSPYHALPQSVRPQDDAGDTANNSQTGFRCARS